MKDEKKILDPDLEAEFKKTFEDVNAKIGEQKEIIDKAFDEIKRLSDNNGIPFEIDFTYQLSDYYTPPSFIKKWFNKAVQLAKAKCSDENEVYSDDILREFEEIVGSISLEKEPGWDSDGWNTSALYC